MPMCGIFGRITPGRPVDLRACYAGTQALAHRGPDGAGVAVGRLADGSARFFLNPPSDLLAGHARSGCDFFLGHRRLAILDLAAEAYQPMSNEDGTVWVVFNGEIYNHQELRGVLQSQGHRFRTHHSDTEVLIHGYEAWGNRLLDRLRGMFAFAVLDLGNRSLLLARDRFGEKPLYYRADPSGVSFASELKGLMALDDFDRTLCRTAVADYLHYGLVPAPRSIFRGVSKLRAAEMATLRLDRPEAVRTETYWSLRYEPEPGRSRGSWMDEFRAELREAVRLRLLSDVPLGVFLSGGLDSTIVVREASSAVERPLATFSIGFAEARFDESAYAAQAARRYGTDHHLRQVSARDLLEVVPILGSTFDEPFADSSAVPTYLVSQLAREHVTVALSGDGGDELLAGYQRYVLHARLARLLDRQPGWAVAGLLGPLSALWPEWLRGKGLLRLLIPGSKERYLESFLDRPLVQLARPDWTDGWRGPLESAWPEPAGHLVDQCCAADRCFYIPEDLMVKVDRTSMRVSLEARAPLLDHKLFELIGRMPLATRFDGCAGKLPFREMLAAELGRPFVDRRKHGFGVPLGRWFRRELHEELRHTILDPDGLVASLFPRKSVERLLRHHQRGGRDQSLRLWKLFMLETWHRCYGRRSLRRHSTGLIPRAA